MVAREVDLDLIRNALEAGGSPGFTVARLSGDMSGSKFPNKRITATKPFSLLDPTWFDESKWERISKGRWKYTDSVVLGESRAVNKLIGILSVFRGSRNHKIITLQDNKPVCGASAKGRSTACPLNRTLRRRTALLLASGLKVMMPWIESARQPADSISRELW